MSTQDEKEAIVNLPTQEKIVVVALKHIFDQIKAIEEQQIREIQKAHETYEDKFKEIQVKASQVIKGTPIDFKNLNEKQTFFEQQELAQVQQLCQNNKGIEAYWLTALVNFFEQDLNDDDKQICVAVQNISTNVKAEFIEVQFEFGQNEFINQGKYNRKVILNEGMPTSVQGDSFKWKKLPSQGFFTTIFNNESNPQNLNRLMALYGQFNNDFVPYSLQSFLGLVEEIEEEDGDEEGQDDEEQDEDEGPVKKVKE